LTPREPALTVVIPVWGERYAGTLPRAVASVRSQDATVPIVVVDNASDVDVPAIEGTVAVRSERRLSAGAARNLGLAAVGTELVVLLDADDELLPGALAALRDGLGSDPAAAVYSMALVEGESGRRHRAPRSFVARLARAPRAFALATSLWSLYPIQGAAAMRTAWVRDAGGYGDCDGGEDWVLAVSQAFRGPVLLDPRPGLLYHPGEDSLWRRTRGTASLLAAARHVRARLRSDPAVPRWARAAVPLVAAGQSLLVVAVRPAYRALRHLVALVTRHGGGAG
jgi:glycosyltransferase involved in cell wall biosynthesis